MSNLIMAFKSKSFRRKYLSETISAFFNLHKSGQTYSEITHQTRLLNLLQLPIFIGKLHGQISLYNSLNGRIYLQNFIHDPSERLFAICRIFYLITYMLSQLPLNPSLQLLEQQYRSIQSGKLFLFCGKEKTVFF